MSKKRKVSNTSPTIKIEIKEENLYGDDVLVARGRLKGALQELVEQSEDDSGSSEDDSRKHRYRSPRKKEMQVKYEPVFFESGVSPFLTKKDSNRFYTKVKRRRSDSSPAATAYHHTYVMKLFDRSVDLARFEEDTPLYPICRAWMANQPRNPQVIVKRRASTPDELDYNVTNGDRLLREVYRLPPPREISFGRVPSPLSEQINQNKEDVDAILDYDAKPPVPRDELIRNHLERWAIVKQRWIAQANKNEERFAPSLNILTTIYNKAQENME